MDYFSKNKILIGAIVVLVLVNIATLGSLWWTAGRQPMPREKQGMSPKDFIVSELQFSDEQKRHFEQLRMQHHRASENILSRLRQTKTEFFQLLAVHNLADSADSIVTKKSEEIGRLEIALDMTTFRHFQQIKAMCNEQQREKFDSIVEQVVRMLNAPPRPPDGRRPPPRMGEGMPPDMGEPALPEGRP